MKKLLLIFAILLLSYSVQAWHFHMGGKGSGSSETPTIYGNETTTASANSSNRTRCLRFTTTAAFTPVQCRARASTQDASAGTFECSIFPVGGGADSKVDSDCSTDGTLPATNNEAWNVATWSAHPQLSAATQYLLCYTASEDLKVFYNDPVEDGYYSAVTTCPTDEATSTTEWVPQLQVANYAAW
jgi:hypothetical protein